MLVASLLCVGAMPSPAAETGRPRGYLVFSDTLPVGPGLDATFHVVVPDGVEVLSARLDLWGHVGTLPVAAKADVAGEHAHILNTMGAHAHEVAEAGAHNHTASLTSGHSHTIQTPSSDITLNTSRMSVTLPTHSHIPFGSVVVGYDFEAVTALEHNHTALEHDHQVSVTYGYHTHRASVDEDHAHAIAVDSGHTHLSSTLGEHAHTVFPGVSADPSGSVPTEVRVTLESASASTTLGDVFGASEAGWHASQELQGLIGDGVTNVVLSSGTDGAIEYLLVLGVDTPCSVLAGHGAVGPLAPLEVPVYSPDVPTSASTYLFGASLPAIVPSLDLTQDHEHAVLADGAHAHTLAGAGSHTHDAGGGEHTHNTTVGLGSVTVADATPDWNLLQHSHTLTWAGNQITSVGDYGYGTVESVAHTHTVLGHDHVVTRTSSGEHEHTLSDVAGHTHTMDQMGAHTHDVVPGGAHDHRPVYEPTVTTGPGPTGVRAALDGDDLTDAGGGPWGLAEAPVEIALSPAALVGPHVLRLTAGSEGAVEWVIVLLHAQTRIVASLRSVGDLVAHVPVPVGAMSTEARVFASPYVMTVQPTSSVDGRHTHTTSEGGAHDHAAAVAGTHIHSLNIAEHNHSALLANMTVTVDNSTGIVDLPSHTHTVMMWGQSTGGSRVIGTTGMHTHLIEDHVHDVAWTSSGAHDHEVDTTVDHVHALTTADDHAHTMSGGSHGHALTPAALGDASFTSPSNVSLGMGALSITKMHPGQATTWWAVETIADGPSTGSPGLLLEASSTTLGTLNVIVVITLDSEPPVISLASAPQWVRPGQAFRVSVVASVDIEVATVELEMAGIAVSGPVLNTTTSEIEFECTCSQDATDGDHPLIARGSDLAGNLFGGAIGSIMVDGTAPTFAVRLGEPSATTGGRTWASPSTEVVVEMNDTGSGPGIARYGSAPTQLDTPWDPSSPRILEGLAEGPHELWFEGTDRAGNPTGQPARLSMWLDGTPPEVAMELSNSITTTEPPVTLVGPESVLLLSAEDPSEGSGLARIEHRFVFGTTLQDWSLYTGPLRLGDVVTGTPSEAVLTWRALDVVGNEATVVANLTFDWSAPEPPFLPHLLPEYTNQDNLPVHFFASSDAEWALFRVGEGTPFSVPLEGYGDIDTQLPLVEGENVVFFALKDTVGNTSPWVILGVVTLDKDAPHASTVFPGEGLDEALPGYVVVAVSFSEPVRGVMDGSYVMLDIDMGGYSFHHFFDDGSMNLAIVGSKPVPAGTKVDVHLEFEDLAGNVGTHDMDFTMPGEEQDEVSPGDFLWGLFIGLVLGMVVAYLVVLRLKRGSSHRRPSGPQPLFDMGLRPTPSILAPEGEGIEDRDLGATPAERTEAASEPTDGTDIARETPPTDAGEEMARAPSEPEARTGPEGGKVAEGATHPHDDAVDEELSADLDRLIAQATRPSGPEVSREPKDAADKGGEHLPDPDEETVDPGAR